MRRYTIILDPDPEDGTYTVTVSALPGIVTEGTTLEEAIAMAREAIACHIASLVKHGESIPEEDAHPQAIMIDVDDVAA